MVALEESWTRRQPTRHVQSGGPAVMFLKDEIGQQTNEATEENTYYGAAVRMARDHMHRMQHAG